MSRGGWIKGQSGNPGGRIAGNDKWWREQLRICNGREYIFKFLMDTVRDEDENKKWRFMAAQELLNRSEGRPKEVAAVVNEEAEITQEQLNTELRGIAADQLRGMAPDERQRFLAALEGS